MEVDLKKRHPRLRIFTLPQPRRFVSKRFSDRFPENSDPDFIHDQNEIISLFQEKMLASEDLPDFTFMPSPPLIIWKKIMADDGLHLTDAGKVKLIDYFIRECDRPKMPLEKEAFPPLPNRDVPLGFPFCVQSDVVRKNVMAKKDQEVTLVL